MPNPSERRVQNITARRRERRIRWVAGIYLILTAVLMGRLFVLSVFPNLISGTKYQRGWLGEATVKADFEHFDTVMQSDGRGQIRFRDGTVWAPTPHDLVGWIGLPDQWPSPTKWVQEQGRAGLEATFDVWLNGRPGFRGRLRDAKGQFQSDWSYRLPARPGYDVKTTISPYWQRMAADTLSRAGVSNGAVVILDVRTHQVLAAQGTLSGQPSPAPVLHDAIPGSIFKLVTAAAALESYSVRSRAPFFCDGVAHIQGVHMHCWRPHGRLTLVSAIAQSCDATFAALGVSLGPNPLYVMSGRFGLFGTSVQQIDHHPVLSEAQVGHVYRPEAANQRAAVLANTAIGQEDVRISPLAAANLACTIADGGVYRPVMLVQDAERNGRLRRTFQTTPSRAMSPSTATLLRFAMRQAVTESDGTAHALMSSATEVAAKTGTAELPQAHRVNGWMIGFAPYRDPKIAFAVYVHDEPSALAHRQTTIMTLQIVGALLHPTASRFAL